MSPQILERHSVSVDRWRRDHVRLVIDALSDVNGEAEWFYRYGTYVLDLIGDSGRWGIIYRGLSITTLAWVFDLYVSERVPVIQSLENE